MIWLACYNNLWKIPKEMGIPDHPICLLRNLYVDQEATVITGQGITHWFKIGKGVQQGYILSPCLFKFYAEYITWNARLNEAEAGFKIAGRNIKPQIFRWYHPYGRKRRTKKPLDKSESKNLKTVKKLT